MFKKTYQFLKYIGFGFILFVICLLLFRLFVLEPFVVRGMSMEPNFHDGDYLWIEKISAHLMGFNRGEVIVLQAPDNPNTVYIKRVIGLPGERVIVKSNKVYIAKGYAAFALNEPYIDGDMVKGKTEDITLTGDEIFVMGDNRNVSEDSRYFGPVKLKSVVGRVWFRLLPANDRGTIQTPQITLKESAL